MLTRLIRLIKSMRCVPCLLIALYMMQDKWIRKEIVGALGLAGCSFSLTSLAKVVRGEIPGYWVEDVGQTMVDLKRHFHYEDDMIDHINTSIRGLENDLRRAAVDAIASIGGKRAIQILRELALEDDYFVQTHAKKILKKFEEQ